MSEHYTRNTVSASAWCAKCKKFTQHRIDGVRKGPCLECIARLDKQHAELPTKPEVERQRELFQ
jgi:ribosomal protein L44E